MTTTTALDPVPPPLVCCGKFATCRRQCIPLVDALRERQWELIEALSRQENQLRAAFERERSSVPPCSDTNYELVYGRCTYCGGEHA